MKNLEFVDPRFRYQSATANFEVFYSPGGGSLSGGTYPRGVFAVVQNGKQPLIQQLLLPLAGPDPAKVEEMAALLDEAVPEIARRFAGGWPDAALQLLRETAEAVK